MTELKPTFDATYTARPASQLRARTQPYYPRLAPAVAASGNVRFATNPVASDTLTIGGTAITFVASGATGNQVNIGGNAGVTGDNLLSLLRSSTDANLSLLAYSGFGGGTTAALDTEFNLQITHLTPGAAGNAVTLATTGAATVSGATLSGGADNKTLTVSSSLSNPMSGGRSIDILASGEVTWLGMRDYVIGAAPPFKVVSKADGSRSCPLWKIAFMHTGSHLTIRMYSNTGAGGKICIKVDDQYVTLDPLPLAYAGAVFFYDLPFESVKQRRIEAFGYGLGGSRPNLIWVGANDDISPAPIRGPRCAIFSTSFAEGTTYTNYATGSYPVHFSDAIGWDDIYVLAAGSTSLFEDNAGNGLNYLNRVSDCPIDTEVVLVETNLNQSSATPAQMGTQAGLFIDTARIRAPNAVIMFFDTWKGGVETIDAKTRDQRLAMIAVCAAKNVKYISLTEMPMRDGHAPTTATLAAAAAANAATLSVVENLSPGSTYAFTNGDKFAVRSISGSGPYTVTIGGPLVSAQASGNVATQCGNSLWTGNGRSGATIGWGTSDIMVAPDNTHPVILGSKMIGYGLASLVQGAFH